MAIDAHSTTVPAVQPGLLRTWAGAVPVPTPALTAETVAMLAEVSAEIGENSDLAAAAQVFSDSGNNPEDVPHRGAPICSAADLPCGDIPTTDLAQARHMRRALEGALDHGTALLAALGLPRLMEPGFAPLDPAAIGDAIHLAIALLDALDAADVDLEDDGTAEPWLGWIDGKPTLSDSYDDREAEDDDEREPDDEGDPLDRGELDGWSRPLASCVVISPHAPAMAEREVRRLIVIVSPNVVPLFGGRHG